MADTRNFAASRFAASQFFFSYHPTLTKQQKIKVCTTTFTKAPLPKAHATASRAYLFKIDQITLLRLLPHARSGGKPLRPIPFTHNPLEEAEVEMVVMPN
jgi:hypothetical protein